MFLQFFTQRDFHTRPHTADHTADHIAQGFFDELITTLGQVPELLVAGRGSSLNVAGAGLPLPEIARTLHVSYLVQGSVQRDSDEMRVHVCLVDGNSGFERWSQGYRGNTGNIFGLQEDIARAVSRELGNTLGLQMQAPKQPRYQAMDDHPGDQQEDSLAALLGMVEDAAAAS